MDCSDWTVKSVNFMISGPTTNELRSKAYLCDAVIKVGDVEFPVHEVTMCGCILDFSDLKVDGSDTERRLFVINGVTPEIMEQIIDFAYTSNVTLTNDNVFDLMTAAERYQITGLLDVCSNFIDHHLSPENCVRVWHVTQTVHFPALQKRAFDLLVDHFEEVVELEEFQQLEVDELALILGCVQFNVRQESTAFESIIKWITYKPDERRDKITTLLSEVRLRLLSLSFLKHTVLTNDVVKSNADSHLMVLNAIKVRSGLKEEPQFVRYHETTCLPNAILLATGGECRIAQKKTRVTDIETYDFRTNRWFRGPLDRLMHPVAFHGTAFLNGYLYIVGGIDNNNKLLSNVYRFHFLTYTWREVAPMRQLRCAASVAMLNERIYAMGGGGAMDKLSTAEVYQPETNRWTFIACMNSKRSIASCTTLGNKIYICGGFTGQEHLKTAECYNPDTNQWTLIASMSEHRFGLGVVTYMEEVFAVGGIKEDTFLSSAEAYNPVTNTWRNVPEMLTPRSNFGIAVINKRVFVVGGYNTTTSNQVVCYNSITNSWSNLCELNTSRYGLSCCLLPGLPNMDTYRTPRHCKPILIKREKPMFEVQDLNL